MSSFVIEGGYRLSGEIVPQGAKNEALQVICATLLTPEKVTIHNVPDILDVLKKLHCPKILIELMLLIYRFIFVLLETASAISMSQDCRLGNKNYRTALKSFGMMGSVLMIRAISRSNRLYDAMEARCYDGTIHVLSESRPPKKKVILAIILFDGALFLFALWRRFYL